MIADVEPGTAKDCKVKGSQATGVDHATPIGVLRTLEQYRGKSGVYTEDQHR